MRARIALLVVLGLIAAGGTVTRAQGDDRPLMVNEVADWCEPRDYVNACEGAAYTIRPDGSIQAILNLTSDGNIASDCASGITIPTGIQGWAYVDMGDAGTVVPIAEVTTESLVCELIVSR